MTVQIQNRTVTESSVENNVILQLEQMIYVLGQKTGSTILPISSGPSLVVH